METERILIKGFYRDILKAKDGEKIFDSGWVANTIVNRCRILLAGFMKNDPLSSIQGIQNLAVGMGLKEWDTSGPPPPDPETTTDLVNKFTPVINVADLAIIYMDENDIEVEGPTSRIQITGTLEPDYPEPLSPPAVNTYPLREFGLFGTFNGEEYMINYIRHPVIHKDENATLIRIIRLYF